MKDKILIKEGFFNFEIQDQLYLFCRRAQYEIGWADLHDIERSNRQFFYSGRELRQDIIDLFIEGFKDQIGNYKFEKNVINCSRPGETYYAHSHGDEKVILYYPNYIWNREWGGETMFYDDYGNDLIFSCEYKPNRAVYFEGNVPHSVRAPTYIADQYRFTISLFFKPKTND